MQQMAEQDFVSCEALDQAAVATLLSTAAAFHRWKQAKLKASFKQQLADILEDVNSEEKATKKLKQQVKKSQAREAELLEQLTELQAELSSTNSQISQQRADIHELTTAVDALDAHAAALEQRAAAAEAAHAAEVGRSTALQQQHQRELQEAKLEQQGILKQQQALMDSLAQRDQQMAQQAVELKAAKTAAATAARQLQQMEGVVQATGERAAAAEDGLKTSNELVVKLQQQLAEVKDRYHAELEQLRPLRAAAAESAALKDRLVEASAAAAALAAARDDMQQRLNAANAASAAATEQQRRLEQAAGVKQAVIDAGYAGDLVGVLSQHLDDSQGQLTTLAPRLAAADAAVQQQQRHIQQVATELEQARRARSAAAERGEVLQLLNVQLQAEVKRLAALAGVPMSDWTVAAGPAEAAGNMATSPRPSKPAVSIAVLLSQLQESLDNIEASRRSMARSNPKITAAAKHASAAAAIVSHTSSQLQHMIGKLLPGRTNVTHHHHQQQQQQQEPAVLTAVADSSRQQILAVLTQQLPQQKVALEGLQSQLQQEQQHWQQVLAAAAAAAAAVQQAAGQYNSQADADSHPLQLKFAGSNDVGSASIARRLQDAESELARALSLSSGGGLSDELIVTADVAARDICAMLLELSALVGDAAAVSAAAGDSADNRDVSRRLEVAAARAAGKLQAIQSCSVSVSSSLAELASVAAYLHTAQQQATAATSQLEQLQQLLQVQAEDAAAGSSTKHPQQQGSTHGGSGQATHENIAALELEVAALRLQLQRQEVEVQQLMAREKQLLSGTAELVPAELLTAATAQQDDLAGQVVALQQQLQQQAAAQQYAAEVYVERVAARYKVQQLVTGWLVWRLAAAQGRAERLALGLSEAQAALQRAAQQQQQRSATLATLLKRQVRTSEEQQRLQVAAAVIAAWQRQATRQVQATWLWRGLSELLLQQYDTRRWAHQQQQTHQHGDVQHLGSGDHGPPDPLGESSSKRFSFAASVVRRKQQPGGSCLWSVKAVQLLSLAFGAWRSYTQLESKMTVAQQKLDYVDQLSASLPAWVQQIGNKRRLERAWLAWRLAAAATAAAAASRLAVAPAVAAPAEVKEQVNALGRLPAVPDHLTQDPVAAAATAPTKAAAGSPVPVRKDPLIDTGEARWQLLQDPNHSSSSTLQQPLRPDGEVLPQPPAAAAVGHPSPRKQVVRAAASSPVPAAAAAASPRGLTGLDGSSDGTAAAATAVQPIEDVAADIQGSGQQQQHGIAPQQQKLQQQLIEGTGAHRVAGTGIHPQPGVDTHNPLIQQQQQQQQGSSHGPGTAALAPSRPAAKLSTSISQSRKQQLNLRGRSPPAGLLVSKAAVSTTSTVPTDKRGGVGREGVQQETTSPLKVTNAFVTRPHSAVSGRPRSVSPVNAGSRSAFGRTLKTDEWAPAPSRRSAAAAAAAGGVARGKSGVAGLSVKSSGRRGSTGKDITSARAGQRTGAWPKQQQQPAGGEELLQPAAAEAAGTEAPAASNVLQNLAAITSTLAVMQQQVQTRSRAIFQAGADALHPSAVGDVPLMSQQHQQPLYTLQGLQRRLSASQPGAAVAAHELAHGSGSSSSFGGLQQQLVGCQQHLQQITSSLRVASQPWLYAAQSQTEERPSPGPAAAAGETEGAAEVVEDHNKTTVGQSSIQASAALGSTACNSVSTAGSASNSEGVNLATLLATAAAAGGGEDKQGRSSSATGPAVAAAAYASSTAGPERSRSPAVVIDTRAPQVATSSPNKKPYSIPSSPLRPAAAAGSAVASPEWHVEGQPRKAHVQPGDAAVSGAGNARDSAEMTSGVHQQHTADVPVTTYICGHSSTPGPGSPPRVRLQRSNQVPPLAATDSEQHAAPSSAAIVLWPSSASPVPQTVSNVPRPYMSNVAAAPLHAPALQPVQRLQQQQAAASGDPRHGHKSSAGIAEMVGDSPQMSPPEPGVVRFERLGRSKPGSQ